MKRLAIGILTLAAVLLALPASSHAQSPQISAIGSSGLFLEIGEAAFSGAGASACAWSTSTSNDVVATDTSSGTTLTDTGNSWVVWVPTAGNDCTVNATPASVWGYLQTDSVVGNRCLFNGTSGGCTINYTAAVGTAPANLIETTEFVLPSAVAAALSGGSAFPGAAPNVAGTDIRPEDAEFAATRAVTPCGQVVGTGNFGAVSTNQYLGLGYTNGSTIDSFYSASKFNVITFTLPASFFVQPVGADPIVVAVNSTDASGDGFNNTQITNLNLSTLALYLDGSIGTTRDAMYPGVAEPGFTPVTVMVREPLSGTYNTMEYNAPNTLKLHTSQDVGASQPTSQMNCSGTAVGSNPMHIENTAYGSFRNRNIGTGQELKETFATDDALGYSFWGVSNFAAAPASSKYLTIDGVDPLQGGYTTGVIPTTSAELSKVRFQHVYDGTYPLWSLLRLVYVSSSLKTPVEALAEAAGGFSTTAHPDFAPYYAKSGATYIVNLHVERSHFTPPGIGYTTTPLNGECATLPVAQTQEAGGDVGGIVLSCRPDLDYATTTGSTYINHRN